MKTQIFLIFALRLCLVELKSVLKETDDVIKQDLKVPDSQNYDEYKDLTRVQNSPAVSEIIKDKDIGLKSPNRLKCPLSTKKVSENKVEKEIQRDNCVYSIDQQVNLIAQEENKYLTGVKTNVDTQKPQIDNKAKENFAHENNKSKENLLNSKESPDTSKTPRNENDFHNNQPETENDQSFMVVTSLKEEIRNMFSPNFKSFVFNPLAPVESKFQECETSKNESGTCRYVQHCLLPNVLSSIEQFMNNVCIIQSRYIGVCCPDFPVDTIRVKWENVSESSGREPVQVPEECGVGTNKRIVGGNDATIKAWPWMVALLNNKKKFYCGGVLINSRYVLTAAHCTFGSRNNEIVARLGEFNLSSQEGFTEDYKVTEIKRHGHYARMTLRNDIALLKLHKPVVFNEFIKTVCLPEARKNYTEKIATLTGWGHVQGGISVFTSDILQEASFPVITNEECAALHGVPVPSSLICTAAPDKDKGACNGDSGGPLVLLDDENRWKVIGIVSWGRRGCSTSYPSVFTRVSHYLDWIKEHAV